MPLIWKKWCRLCAKEDDYRLELSNGSPGPDFILRISKYLSIQIDNQTELSNSICQECCDTLESFDVYALKCEKVQLMFRAFTTTETSQDDESIRALKLEFLQNTVDDKKLVPICVLKSEEEKKEAADIMESCIDILQPSKKRKMPLRSDKFKNSDDSLVKDEVLSDDGGLPMSNNSDSEDDHIPLANVTLSDQKPVKVRKKKSSKKGLKHSSKIKRKKGSKTKDKIEATLDDIIAGDLNIKEEPLSDEDNMNDADPEDIVLSLNLGEDKKALKKVRKQRKKSSASFIKYECYICGEDSRNWHALCVHFRDVHDMRAKVMCCCGKFLASRVSIGRHCAKHGKSDSHNCLTCNKRFPRESELTSHMITHLPKEEYPFVCCKCARRFTTQQLLRHHEKKHIPMEERLVHPCEICKSMFASKSSLMMHMKAVHERLKPFVCDQCGRAFTTKGILEEHQVRHSDARPHVCPVCHKSFKTKQRLAIHSDTHNDTVYQCPHCPIQLNSRRTLRMHLFVHDEVCRYQCNFCDKAFKRAKDLKNHSNLHTGRRPYSCPWCSRTFANGSNCRAHKRRMHPNELRISDASAAMVNKVPVPPSTEPEETKNTTEAGPPKVIYTTVKRKIPATPVTKVPNFSFRPDVTEKSHDSNAKVISDRKEPANLSNLPAPINDAPVAKTKQEKSSPLHSYESSMSPLNLNTSAATNKYSAVKADSGLTITPVSQGEESITEFQDVADNYNSILHSRGLEPNFPSDYKDNHDQIFAKSAQQLYANFGGNAVTNLYNATSSATQFASSNPYGLHFSREEGN